MRKDYKQTEDGDIAIINGDFAVVESDEQHVHDIMMSTKGSWRMYPLFGFGIMKYIKASSSKLGKLKRELLVELNSDGYKGIVIDMKDGIEKMIVRWR